MADKWLVASGNTSNPANWNGGTLPTSADDCYADGFTGTIDANLTVLSIRTTQRTGGTAGGGFILNAGVTLTAGGTGFVSGTATCLTFSANSPNVSNAIGNVVLGGSTNLVNVITQTGTGTLNVTGNVSVSAIANVNRRAILLSGNGTLNFVGNVTDSVGHGNTTVVLGAIENAGSGTVNITGNVVGSQTSNAGFGALNTSSGSIIITGSVTGGNLGDNQAMTAAGVGNRGSGRVTVNGNVVASGTMPGIVNGSLTSGAGVAMGTVVVNGDIVSSAAGVPGVASAGRLLIHATQAICHKYRVDNSGAAGVERALYTGGVNLGQPAIANVRQGTVFGASNEYTGTLIVPNPAYVSLGVPTDNTVGTLSIDLSSVLDRLPASLEGGRIQAVLSSTVLTQLFADADVTDLVNQIAAKFDAVDDLPIATIAAAVRDALLNRILAGNHDTDGTPGKILQTVLTQSTSAASSAATAATQSTAANTNAAAAKVASESADGKLSTGRLALIDGSAQKGTGSNTLASIANLIENLETGGLTPPQAETLDSIAVALAGSAPVETTGATETVVARLTRIENATSAIGSKPLEYLSNVADGGQLLLTIGDDHETVIANDLRIRAKDPGQTLFNKLTAAGVTLQWSAGQGTTPNLITGTVSTPTHADGITTIVVQVPNTPSPAAANIFAPFHWQLQRTIGGRRHRMLKGSLKLEPDMIGI